MEINSAATYNCGGFALKRNEWVTPYDRFNSTKNGWTAWNRDKWLMGYVYQHKDRRQVMRELITKDTNYLLTTYPELTQVKFDDCSISDRLIAYRVSLPEDLTHFNVNDVDFHFRVRIRGRWYEKPGADEVARCTDAVFAPWVSEEDELVYDSPIVFFKYAKI